jgi:hypothetical protein
VVYADGINILGGSLHTIQENTETLVVASKEIGLELDAHNTRYMVISRGQNGGRSDRLKIDNSSFERAEGFKYLGTTLTNKNSIDDEIKSRLKPGDACYHSVQNIFRPVCYPKI